MPVYRFRKLSKIELKLHDAWTDLVGAVNSVSRSKEKMDTPARNAVKNMKAVRRQYRKGEIIICDGDPEVLFSGVITGEMSMITADYEDKNVDENILMTYQVIGEKLPVFVIKPRQWQESTKEYVDDKKLVN